MPDSLAIAGHGALIAMEKDPVGAPGIFTTIAELNGDIVEPGYEVPETEVTAHQHDIDYWIPGRLGRSAVTFSVNFIHDNDTHDHLTGLKSKIAARQRFGIRFRGPGWTTVNVNEFIASGFLTNMSITNPVREGARTADITMRLSGPHKDNGVIID